MPEPSCTAFHSLSYVGVVVIGRNEGERLERCFCSLGSGVAAIVYVDSGSTDGSLEVARAHGAIIVPLDISQPFTAARARNVGFQTLKGLRPDIEFVQFIDGDCEMAEGWLERSLAFLEQRPDTAVVCGRRRERHPDHSIYNRMCDSEWNTPIGEAQACGGDSLMRVSAFESVGGFNPALMAGEEPEFCLRLRERAWKIWRVDAEMTTHDAAITRFSQWWRRCVRGGYGYAEVARLHKKSPSRIYARECARAMLWGGIAPVAISLAAVIHPAALFGASIYPLQICRIAWRRGAGSGDSWSYAFFITLAKFAELTGIIKFYSRHWLRTRMELIEYKGPKQA